VHSHEEGLDRIKGFDHKARDATIDLEDSEQHNPGHILKPETDHQFLIPGQTPRPLVTNRMMEEFNLQASWASPGNLRGSFAKGHENLSWYKMTQNLTSGSMDAVWEPESKKHFSVVMHPQLARLMVVKARVYMIFEMPDAEIFKYPPRTQGLVIWLQNTRLWNNWFKPVTGFTAERYTYRNYPVSVSFAPWWLPDYKPGEYIVWKWCVDQQERAGSTGWITSLLGREELKHHKERLSLKKSPLTPETTAFSADSHVHPAHREILRGVIIDEEEVDDFFDRRWHEQNNAGSAPICFYPKVG
jgi:hypothetical protein